MASPETRQINAINATWAGASGAATDIDEAIGSPDTAYYGAGAEADAADFGFTASEVVDGDTVTNISFNMIYRDDGSAGTLLVDVDLLIGGTVVGTAVQLTVSGSDATYSDINDTGWNVDRTAAEMDGAELRLTPQQSGMPGTNAGFLETANMVVTFSSGPTPISIEIPAAQLQISTSAPTLVCGGNPALEFSGTSQYVQCGDVHDFTGTAAFTVEFRMNANSTQPNSFARLVSKEQETATREGWVVLLNTGAGAVRFERWLASGGAAAEQTYSGDTDHHVACVYDGTDMQVFVDGSGGSTSASSASLIGHAFELTFGANAQTPTGDEFAGILDEIRIWDYARTSADINRDKDIRLQGSEDGLVGYWRIDEGTGTNLTDEGSGGNDGTITGATWTWAYPNLIGDGIEIPAAQLALSTTVPTIDIAVGGIEISPPAAQLQISSAAPSVNFGYVISPPAANLQITTTAPLVNFSYTIEIPAANLQISTAAPTVNFGYSIEIPAANIQFSTAAPVIAITDNVSISPPAANLSLSTAAPLINFAYMVSPPAAQLQFTTTVPVINVEAGITIEPPAANLALSTTAPTIVIAGRVGRIMGSLIGPSGLVGHNGGLIG